MTRLRKYALSLAAALATLATAAAQTLPQTRPENFGTPPPAPSVPARVRTKAVTSFGTNFLVITNRETARQFFNLVYAASEDVPMDWSGSYATGNPGTNSTEYLRAVMRRVNYYRAMAGLPATITFNDDYSRKAQAAALMMGGNNSLSHFPPTNWLYYTEEGAEAARNSNLSLGNPGPQAVMGQMRDNGANNTVAGHRRWILYPPTQVMGSGSVPRVGPSNSASALWVFDDHYSDPRPASRDTFVSWPPPGYVPYQVTYARWSFAYPNADFSQTTIAMTSNSVPISVALEPIANGFGENTIVWIPAGLDADALTSFARPAADTIYHVTLNNVRIGGTPQTFSYDVIVFDPAVPGNDFISPMLSGPAQPFIGAMNLYSFNAVNNANAYEWRQSRVTNTTFVDGAENGLTNFTVRASTDLYDVRESAVTAAGNYSFHLAHPEPVSQTLTLDRAFLAASNSAVRFRSRLGYATSFQTARVQASLDDGSSWQDIYTQTGSDGSGENTFATRTASLSGFAGHTLRLRLSYDVNPLSFYDQTSSGVGWYVDNFTVTNALQVLSPVVGSANLDRTFAFAPAGGGTYLLEVRPVLFGDYPSQWGPALTVNAVVNSTVAIHITSLTATSANTWQMDFTVLSGSPAGFEIWSAPSVPGVFAKEAGATIQTIQAGSRYRATVTASGAQRFFQVKAL